VLAKDLMKSNRNCAIFFRGHGRGVVPAGSVTPPRVTHKHVVVFRREYGQVPQQSGGVSGGSHPQGQGQPDGAPPTMPVWCDPPGPEIGSFSVMEVPGIQQRMEPGGGGSGTGDGQWDQPASHGSM
jgi:hypothetical protein